MAVLSTLSLLDVTLAVLGLYLVKRLLAAKPPAPYPPGPPALPLIGNLLQYPQQQEWKTFYDWAEKYGEHRQHGRLVQFVLIFCPGDLVMVNLLGQRMLLINSAKVAVDMLGMNSFARTRLRSPT